MSQVRRPSDKRGRRRVNGVLFIDKPAGITSNGVLGVLKRLYNTDKAGHTGTLDPFATGLLPVALGEATKFIGHLLDAGKTYRATMRLGVTTDTGDLDGAVLETRPVSASEDQLREVLVKFRGEMDQVPPMHSALKRDGKPLYEYARAGITLERAPRRVTIYALDLLGFDGASGEFRVACSKGTYVRTLAEDIGAALGCGAHLTALRRERSGPFAIDRAITLSAIEATPAAQRDALLLPLDALIQHLPRIDVDAAATARLRLGQKLSMHSLGVAADGLYRIYDQAGALTGLVEAAVGAIRPERLVAQHSHDGA